jgi:hypothetical protein
MGGMRLELPPEVWMEHPDWEGYLFSSRGRIRGRRGTILKQIENEGGYLWVGLYKGFGPDRKQFTVFVNRVICEVFNEPAPGPWPEWHCAHLDNNPHNNCFWNLAWKTPAENVADQIEAGTHPASNQEMADHLSRCISARNIELWKDPGWRAMILESRRLSRERKIGGDLS